MKNCLWVDDNDDDVFNNNNIKKIELKLIVIIKLKF